MNIYLLSTLVVVSILAIIITTSKLKLNVFASLFLVSFFLAIFTIPLPKLVETLKTGFGQTMGAVSFIIIFGAIIAIVLEKSGAAISITNKILSIVGINNTKSALAITGFIPGLTIFCDTGFIILSGIAKNFSIKSKISMPLLASILACALFSVHCLVPIHPGVLAAANTMKVDNLGFFILAGTIFAIPGFIVAYLWINWIAKYMIYSATANTNNKQLQFTNLPSFALAITPIVLPLILISIASITVTLGIKDQNILAQVINFIGNPVIALLIGVVASFILFKNNQVSNTNFNDVIDEAIKKAGPILIITAAGGMFGLVIKETGAGNELGQILGGTGIGLFVPFLIAALLKTAQGSSTIAAITAAAILEPTLADFGLASETGRLFAVLAMGAGSIVVSHANDSFFWVVTKFSDIDVNDSLKVFTSSTFVMGCTSFLCIWIASLFFI